VAYNILIVDDSSTVRSMIRKTLGLTKLVLGELLEAGNGAEALELLRANWVDLVLCDINMPIMNGFEFVAALRGDELLRDIPVAIISTEGSEDRISELEALGISGYLRKPFKPEEIGELVLGLLQGESNHE
jgi:two-component system chemotaxis response regulator CheY